MLKIISFFACCLLIISCNNQETTKEHMHHHSHSHRIDHHSFSKPEEAVSKHLSLDLKADFETRILSGSVTHKIKNHGSNKIIFDVKNLDIKKTTISDGFQSRMRHNRLESNTPRQKEHLL